MFLNSLHFAFVSLIFYGREEGKVAMHAFVAILMGSDSDLSVMESTVEVLESFQIPFEIKVSSAHRTPEATHQYVKEADARGCKVFICAAGMAAHLAGAVAANTVKPVIGVPIDAGPLNGFDALLSTVQMPAGIPVATVAIGKAGAKNAGFLAAQMFALSDDLLSDALKADRQKQAEKILQKNEGLLKKMKRE